MKPAAQSTRPLSMDPEDLGGAAAPTSICRRVTPALGRPCRAWGALLEDFLGVAQGWRWTAPLALRTGHHRRDRGGIRPLRAGSKAPRFYRLLGCGCAAFAVFAASAGFAASDYPAPTEGDFIARDFHFQTGESLPELRLHYRAIGHPVRDGHGVVGNAVLVMHGTTGSGGSLIRPEFAGELFGPGQLLDASRFYIILPDGIGHGKSSKPSDGLRARFPHYAYLDMIEADYRLLTEGLKVNHLRLVMGTSMGGMHTWLWGELHPDFMDALMPLASLPARMSGRNRVWRRIIIDAIRTDPEWLNGDYINQPRGLRLAAEMLYFMGSNPVLRQKEAPTVVDSDRALDQSVSRTLKALDANDVLYALDSSRDYDPGPGLERIQAPLVAVNSADDLINPPELGILELEIKKVKKGRAVLIPLSEQTRGHGTHTVAVIWKEHLAALLKESETR